MPFVWGQNNDIATASWLAKPIVVDGSSQEWEKPFRYYNSSAGLSFAMANDQQYLYLCFKTAEPYKIIKMLRAGWTLRLSCKERRKRLNAWLNFKSMYIDLVPKEDYNAKSKTEKPTFGNWLDDYYLNQLVYEVAGFRKTPKYHTTTLEEQGKEGIQIALNYTKEEAVVEMAIPLEELFLTKHITLEEVLKMRILIDDLVMPDEDSKLSGGEENAAKTTINGTPPNGEDTPLVKPKDFGATAGIECLYYKASFAIDFKLNPGK